MKDPGNPRRSLDPDDDRTASPQPTDLVASISVVLRMAGLLAVFGLFAMGAFYAVRVFGQLGSLITEPGSARESVATIAEMIDEEQLTFSVAPESQVAPGRLIAFLLLLFCYVLWIWIPMKLVFTCGKILVEGLRTPKKAGDKQPRGNASDSP